MMMKSCAVHDMILPWTHSLRTAVADFDVAEDSLSIRQTGR